MFFTEFNTWLTGLLNAYVAQTTRTMATALEPAALTVCTLYVLVWGYLHITGRIQEPVLEGLRRIAILVVVIGVGLDLWLYNDVIVQIFFRGPGELAGALVGAHDFAGTIDQVMARGDAVAGALLSKAGILHGNFSFYLGAIAVWALVGLTAVYTMFLLTLSMIALSVLLALGPLFIPLFLFDATRRFVEAWLAQLCNFAFVTVLAAVFAALMLTLIDRAAAQAQSTGGGIQLAHAVRVCLAAGFTFLVMRQVLPIAAGLSSGVALVTYGVVSGGVRQGRYATGQFLRGALMDTESWRTDSFARKAGFYTRSRVRALWTGRSNSIRRD